VALGGVATIPWRSREAEAALEDRSAVQESFVAAAEAAMADAKPREQNRFKIELAKRTIIFALEELMRRA
jgi:xanthine dehydrogenase YagS FAD-binding subunit